MFWPFLLASLVIVVNNVESFDDLTTLSSTEVVIICKRKCFTVEALIVISSGQRETDSNNRLIKISKQT
jgi:hypothetical protein